jgi:hypothetical protein
MYAALAQIESLFFANVTEGVADLAFVSVLPVFPAKPIKKNRSRHLNASKCLDGIWPSWR